MPTRRQIIQRTAVAAAMLALGPLLPSLVRAAEALRRREIPSTGEMLPVIGLGTSRTHDVALDDPEMTRLLEVLRVLVDGRLRVPHDAPFFQADPALVVCCAESGAATDSALTRPVR